MAVPNPHLQLHHPQPLHYRPPWTPNLVTLGRHELTITKEIRDVSHHDYDRGDTDVSMTPMLIVKFTQGSTYTDPRFGYWMGKGKPVAAYHCVEPNDASGQVDHMLKVIGKNIPVMFDWEVWTDPDGSNKRWATIAQAKAVVQGFINAGGNAKMTYIPHWFWEGELNNGDLSWFADQGLFNINSNYSLAPCDPAAMAGFGGMTNKMHQYTNSPHDKNAFPGTVDELLALWGLGGNMTTPLTATETGKAVWGIDPPTGVTNPADVVRNPWQRTDSTLHNPPGTNETTTTGFALGDMWQLAYDMRDTLAAQGAKLDQIIAALGSGSGAALTDAQVVADVKEALREGTA